MTWTQEPTVTAGNYFCRPRTSDDVIPHPMEVPAEWEPPRHLEYWNVEGQAPPGMLTQRPPVTTAWAEAGSPIEEPEQEPDDSTGETWVE